jgi:hypothetical protein
MKAKITNPIKIPVDIMAGGLGKRLYLTQNTSQTTYTNRRNPIVEHIIIGFISMVATCFI